MYNCSNIAKRIPGIPGISYAMIQVLNLSVPMFLCVCLLHYLASVDDGDAVAL